MGCNMTDYACPRQWVGWTGVAQTCMALRPLHVFWKHDKLSSLHDCTGSSAVLVEALGTLQRLQLLQEVHIVERL
jgi:hypothetical protein